MNFKPPLPIYHAKHSRSIQSRFPIPELTNPKSRKNDSRSPICHVAPSRSTYSGINESRINESRTNESQNKTL